MSERATPYGDPRRNMDVRVLGVNVAGEEPDHRLPVVTIRLVGGSVEVTRIVGLALDDNVKIVARKPEE